MMSKENVGKLCKLRNCMVIYEILWLRFLESLDFYYWNK